MSLIFSNLVDLKSGSECELYLLQVMIRIAFFCIFHFTSISYYFLLLEEAIYLNIYVYLHFLI